jgi:hypothetical protein
MNDQDILFEQYKLYVETAEKVSDRRQSANNFFLTINSAIVAFTGFLTTQSFQVWHIIVAIAGLSISILWLLTLRSFRSLNTCKFKVIHELEEKLPSKLFTCEWNYLGQGKSKRKYLKLSVIEQGIPIIFSILYIALILLMVFSWSGIIN